MTPRDVLIALETSKTAPITAIQAALDAKEDMLPAFLAEIERARHTPWEDLPYRSSYSLIFCILGQWGDPRACLPLAGFLRLEEDTLDALLGDSLTEEAARVMANVAGDDLSPIFDVLLDRKADLFARAEMISALLRIAITHPERRAAVEALIADFHLRVERDADPYLLVAWAEAVGVLGLTHLNAQAREAVTENADSIGALTLGEFEDILRASADDPTGQWFLKRQARPTAIDIVGEVSSWYGYSEKYIKEREQELAEEELSSLWNEPDIAFNPYRDIGRNDPCPCGSGKKYKKCCLK